MPPKVRSPVSNVLRRYTRDVSDSPNPVSPKASADPADQSVLTDPDHIRAYYQGDAKVHPKAPGLGFGEYMNRILGEAVGFKHNEDWRRLRAHMDPYFTSQKSSELLPIMISDTGEWLESLPRLSHVVRNEKDNKLAIRAEELVSTLPFRMIARRVFDELLDDKLLDELSQLNTVHERVMTRAFFGKFEQWKIFKYLPVQANRDVGGFERDWAALLERTSLEAEKRGIITTVSDMYKDMKEGHMSFPEFAHSVDEILFTNMGKCHAVIQGSPAFNSTSQT
jgi:cytochrome P450